MADAFRQMQKKDFGESFAPSSGRRTSFENNRMNVHPITAKKYSRKRARARLKQLDDDFVGARR